MQVLVVMFLYFVFLFDFVSILVALTPDELANEVKL